MRSPISALALTPRGRGWTSTNSAPSGSLTLVSVPALGTSSGLNSTPLPAVSTRSTEDSRPLDRKQYLPPGVRCSPWPESTYFSDRSSPKDSQDLFACHVKISNIGTETAQLVSREWIITSVSVDRM